VILRGKAYPANVALQSCAVLTVLAVQTRRQFKEEKQMEGKTANCRRDKDLFGVFPLRDSDGFFPDMSIVNCLNRNRYWNNWQVYKDYVNTKIQALKLNTGILPSKKI
jgi:hypothetical protein